MPREPGGRVVVTGMGVVSPVGLNIDDLWTSLISGRSGVDYIASFDTGLFETKFAAEVRDFDVTAYVEAREARRMDRFAQFAVVASLQAVQSARLRIDPGNAVDTGVIIGNSVCGLLSISHQWELLREKGPGRISPILAPTMSGDAAPVQVSLMLGTKGPNFSVSSTCSSGNDAIGMACGLIRGGDASAVVAGGTEAPIMPICLAAFNSARVLSTRNDDPKTACRPFDARRDGFVLGEGSAMLVLESLEHALRRDAPILAEVVAYSSTSDAFHLTQPSADGQGAARALRLALNKAGLQPEDIDYINAHGTSTILNDRIETMAIKTVFGKHAYRVPISATKSTTGHLLGAAGAIEAVIAILAMNRGMIPPTINLVNPDPECDLDYVPNQARKADINVVASNSFGFGGHNSVVMFRRYAEQR